MPAPKAQKAKDPDEEAHEAWFFALDHTYVVQLMREWNESKLAITIKKKKNYDDWLDYFKTLPANTTRMLALTGADILTTEGFAACRRWADILNTPGRIDKIHQAGLSAKGKNKNSIVSLALANDRLGVLKATRDKIAEKLDKGAGNRDTALLTAQITEIMTQIADQEKRLGPKKDTALGQLMQDIPDFIAKRPGKNGGGARNTSFKSRVTIDDLEEDT